LPFLKKNLDSLQPLQPDEKGELTKGRFGISDNLLELRGVCIEAASVHSRDVILVVQENLSRFGEYMMKSDEILEKYFEKKRNQIIVKENVADAERQKHDFKEKVVELNKLKQVLGNYRFLVIIFSFIFKNSQD
jgi:hypothetical protein